MSTAKGIQTSIFGIRNKYRTEEKERGKRSHTLDEHSNKQSQFGNTLRNSKL